MYLKVRKGFRDVQNWAFVFTEHVIMFNVCNFALISLKIYHFYVENAQNPFQS